MRIGPSSANKARVALLTADTGFAESARAAFVAHPQLELDVIHGTLAFDEDKLAAGSAAVLVIDLDAAQDVEMHALQALIARTGNWPPVLVITQTFDEMVARALLQMRVADFLVKPVAGDDLLRACARVPASPASGETTEAQIFTFVPAVGGAGVTTLAVQTAMLLLQSGQRGPASTCLVDLDFQHGACADHLDLEPRLNLSEIEPRPERLDRQLLEVMLSHHASGLALIAAPNRPAEMRSFDPDMVTRLLDLVSSNFEYVVFDVPRTWFSWTDSVLLGSNNLFVVSEMTVPGLRHARQLVGAIRERLGDSAQPKIIINRYEQRMFGPGLRRADIEQALGQEFIAVPNHYSLVREAIDRGVPLDDVKPRNRISQELKKLIGPIGSKAGASQGSPLLEKLKLSWAR